MNENLAYSSNQEYELLYKKFRLIYSAFEHSTDAILITDLSGKILEINHAFTRLFGYTPEDLIGQTTRILRSPKSEDLLFQEMWEKINTNGEWRGEILNRSRDGVEIPIWLIITPILDQGKKIGYMGIEIDLREKKKMDERLLFMGRLATIGKISAQMVHEIRNPLSSMSLNLELLQDELENFTQEDTREAKHLVASITSEIERLSTVNEEYLAFARLPKFSPKKSQVNTILEQLQDLFLLESSKQNVQIQLKLSPIPLIYADEKQLRQAFLNLIKNALEAMPTGGVLRICTQLNPKNEIEISFEDNGCGIEEKMIPQIFDPFFTTKDKGTGLGLSVTLQIIEEHHGQIECQSSLGKGSTFLIRIPLLLNKP
ncbi:MAG: ATP-binding protein [Planctomycetota bacterium]